MMEIDDSSRTGGAEVEADSVQEDGSDLDHPAQRTLLWSDPPRESSDAAAAVPSFLGPFDVSQFYDTGRFSDVGIVCADGDIVRAHQVVLGATCAYAKRFLIRTQKFLPADSDVTVVMPDFSRHEVDALMRILYGQDQSNGEDGVSEELLKALGCSYEVSQLSRAENETVTSLRHFDSRISTILEKAICEWDMKDDSGRFLCPEEDCRYAHLLRKRVKNHLGVVHRKVVCPQCGDVINRKQMEQHFKSKHELKGEVKVEKNDETVEDDSDNDDHVSSVKYEDEDRAWAKDSDEDYAPSKKKIKKGRTYDVGEGADDNGTRSRENPGNLLCSVDGCEFSSKNRAAMNSHMSQDHRKITCSYCNKKVSRFSMDEHVLRVHRTSADAITASEVQRTLDENKSVACPPCGKRLPLNELNHHIAKEHCDGNVDSIKDSIEEDGDDSPRRKVKRRRRKRYERDPSNPSQILCPHEDCDFSAPAGDRARMNTHLCYVHRRPVCPFCKMACNRSKFQEHIARKHTKIPDYSCEQCPKQFYNKVELRQHRIRFHDAKDDEGKLCRLCNTLVRNEARFKIHVKQCCAKKGISEEEYNDNANGKCGPVRLPFDYEMNIDPDNPGKCPKCDLRGTAGAIRKHFREAHARPQCPFCGKEYSLYFMSRHIATKHTQKLDYQCEICSMRFWKEKQLQHHKDEVHVKEAKYVCEHCGKAFHSQIQLSRHRTKHHNTLRHFSCPLCDKVYYNKSSLKKHIRLHHGQFYDGKTADGIKESVDLAAARRAQDAAAVAAAVTQQIQQQDDQHLPQQHVQQHVELHTAAIIHM